MKNHWLIFFSRKKYRHLLNWTFSVQTKWFPNSLNIVLFIVSLLLISVVFFPFYGAGILAEHSILNHHSLQNAPRWKTHLPLLYLSWFKRGNTEHADEMVIYPSGNVFVQRVIWNEAIQGGLGGPLPKKYLNELEKTPKLPEGLPGAYSVSTARILVVSQNFNDQWRTEYYDRMHLPPIVQAIVTRFTEATGFGIDSKNSM